MKNQKHPPGLFLRFFRWFCDPKMRDYIEGDLMEVFNDRTNRSGKKTADMRFIIDVLLLFRPGIIKIENSHSSNTYAMLESYFKIGWRNLLRNKGYSVINIGGLALGMAVAMVIGLWVYDELSFNRYHQNYDQIAQVMKGGQFEGRRFVGQKSLPFPLIDELKNNYAANFKHVVPASWRFDGVLSIPEKNISKTGIYLGEAAPEMFTWKMKYGSWSGLNDVHGVMLSESTALALFGDGDPINKVLKINSTAEAKVTGVFEDLPKNTEFYGVHFVQPWQFLLADAAWLSNQGWDNHFLHVYVQINPNKTFKEVTENIINAENIAIRDLAYMKDELKYNYEVLLLPMRDWHLHADFREGVLQTGPVQFVWFIGSIGIFVLLLACINFMNLSTARSEKRAKEVGIRKTIGSVRRQLISQFFSESFLVVIIGFVIAICLVNLSLPWFNDLSAKDMHLPWKEQWFWMSTLSFVFITGLLAGSYPAIYLSSFNPVSILKGRYRAGRLSSLPRKVLVVAQFTVSIMLIICTGVIYNQLMFVKDRPVGYSREGLIMVTKKSPAFTEKADVLKTELLNSGAVSVVAESGGAVTQVWSNNGGFTWKGMDPGKDDDAFATLGVSHDFGRAVGWEFIDGRDFSKDIASDSSGFVINEAAARYMGLKDPVGEIVHWKNGPWEVDNDFRILGVIKDMVMGSPFEPIQPTIYLTKGWKNWILLRVTPGVALSEALPKIENTFTTVIPDVPFLYKFASEEYQAKFATEDRIGKLAAVFSILAIIISCLGLFGLASFVAEQRTKEIGIRKVMGASVAHLWRMLSGQFVLLVMISCLIASPLSYYVLLKGLKDYEYKTDISWEVFAMAGLLAFAITLFTVSFQAVKAALANPVNSLRSE
jgi:putative ABC transport system permease protein